MDNKTKDGNLKEEEVLKQEVSADELDGVAGGDGPGGLNRHCIKMLERDISGDGCAATVEDSSWCGDNDACIADAVQYYNMYDCSRAWH